MNDLSDLGYTPHFARGFAQLSRECEVPARVIAVHRNRIVVDAGFGERNATLTRTLQDAAALDRPATGDWVVVELDANGDDARVRAVIPRATAFIRQAAGTGSSAQVVAANIDKVFIVTALPHDVNERRLERYLTVAWESGAVPVIVLTKADLVDDVDEWISTVRRSAPGVDVVACSALDAASVAALHPFLIPGETIALLGSSGVGKSTLLNAIANRDAMRTGAVDDDGRGRHTTTHRELVSLRSGVLVIDTPGMRELQLWSGETGLDRVFDDITALAEGCRFGDCAHAGEPDCAVAAAIANGVLDADRLASWRKLAREIRRAELQQDAVAAAAERAKLRSLHKAIRIYKKF